MPFAVRLLGLLTVVALLAIPMAPSAYASTRPRLPTSEVDWASFSPLEKNSAIAYEYQLLQRDLAAGTAIVHEVGEEQFGSASPLVSVSYACPIQWINYVNGTFTRGGGWTDANANMYYIYAGESGTYSGRFYRDGVQIHVWFSSGSGSHVENWTAYDWKWWFESPRYFNVGYHGAQQYQGGAWQPGPHQYCSAAAQP